MKKAMYGCSVRATSCVVMLRATCCSQAVATAWLRFAASAWSCVRSRPPCLLTCPGVKEATLQSASDTLNGTYIVAYVTGDSELDAEAIKQHVAALKPEYMVPEVVMQIDEIPRNNNGKVDRERLPKPVRSAPRLSSDDMQQPESDLQRELHQIIAKEIGTEDFGINTPLLYVGLTSVSAIKLAVQVNN